MYKSKILMVVLAVLFLSVGTIAAIGELGEISVERTLVQREITFDKEYKDALATVGAGINDYNSWIECEGNTCYKYLYKNNAINTRISIDATGLSREQVEAKLEALEKKRLEQIAQVTIQRQAQNPIYDFNTIQQTNITTTK